MSYDTAYRASDRYFGAEPDGFLLAHLDTLDPAWPVLDLGMGQGRNALWLARRGFRVEGIEPSKTARAAVREVAAMEGLSLGVHADRFQEFDAGEASFGTVLALGLIPILSRAELRLLKERVDRWLAPSGILVATAFTSEDPSYARISAKWSPSGKNSFLDAEGSRRTFLLPREILRLFAGYEVLHHEEVLGEEHRHGDGPLHRHAWTRAMLRCPIRG